MSSHTLKIQGKHRLAQAGEPVAFFVGRNPEGVDAFVTGVLKAGFGEGGPEVTNTLLSKVWQVRGLLNRTR